MGWLALLSELLSFFAKSVRVMAAPASERMLDKTHIMSVPQSHNETPFVESSLMPIQSNVNRPSTTALQSADGLSVCEWILAQNLEPLLLYVLG